MIHDAFLTFLRTGALRDDRNLRYMALNYLALNRFGTLEIRTFRGVSDPTEVLPWANILLELYNVSDTFNSPDEILNLVSMESPRGFVERRLPLTFRAVYSKHTVEQLEQEIYEGIRFAQDLAYGFDWTPPKKYATKEPTTVGTYINDRGAALVQEEGLDIRGVQNALRLRPGARPRLLPNGRWVLNEEPQELAAWGLPDPEDEDDDDVEF